MTTNQTVDNLDLTDSVIDLTHLIRVLLNRQCAGLPITKPMWQMLATLSCEAKKAASRTESTPTAV